MCVPEQIGTCTPLPPPPPQDSITTDSATLAWLKEAISAAEATPPAALARLPELWPAEAGVIYYSKPTTNEAVPTFLL